MSEEAAGAPTPDSLLDLAVAAACLGAAEIERRAAAPRASGHKSSPTDPVSEADAASASAIVRFLARHRPDDGLLIEDVAEKPSHSGLRWVIDPLDGTVNHLYRVPHGAVSVACEEADGDTWDAVVGVVHDCFRSEVFTAARGGQARLNGADTAVNQTPDLSLALIATELSYSAASRRRQAAALARVAPAVRDIRISGSSTLDLCWVAAGRFDGFYEDELFRWDWSAAALVVRAAGGTVSGLDTGVVASGPRLHDQLRAAVTGAEG